MTAIIIVTAFASGCFASDAFDSWIWQVDGWKLRAAFAVVLMLVAIGVAVRS